MLQTAARLALPADRDSHIQFSLRNREILSQPSGRHSIRWFPCPCRLETPEWECHFPGLAGPESGLS